MKLKYFYIFILFSILLFSINSISANEINLNDTLVDSVYDNLNCNNDNLISSNHEEILSENLGDSLEVDDTENLGDFLEVDDIIYVGSPTSGEGNGTMENPYKSLELACNNCEGKDNVTIHIFDGKYYFNKELKFNCSNLNIVGIGNNVSINSIANTDIQAISFVDSSANFTFSNILFNLTNQPSQSWKMLKFFIVNGYANYGTFKNCTFIGGKKTYIKGSQEFKSQFINCKFSGFTVSVFYDPMNENTLMLFKNCVICLPDNVLSLSTTVDRKNGDLEVLLDGIWFGQNDLPSYINVDEAYVEPRMMGFQVPVSKYAVFNVIQNYLGNNEYKITGKLTWNGTNDTVGDIFAPMTVLLESEYGGEYESTVTLVNGTFETIYKNSASNHHKITASLHNQDIPLEFYTLNITAKEANIYYGDNQNITVNLSQAINSNVTIIVSNATDKLYSYSVKINGIDSFNFTIPDRLKAGTYDINITLNENNLYGIGTTTLTVSKVSDYKFEVIPSSNVKVGDTATINITLPDDVNGTVIVKFANETRSSDANTTMTFNFTNLKAITYPINVTYGGSDKYTSKEVIDSVTVGKADSSIEIENAAFIYGETIAIPFNITNANGVTVSVLNKDDDELYTETVFNEYLRDCHGYEYFDKDLRQDKGYSVEIMDLYKDGVAFSVKKGSGASKLAYVVDQCMDGIKYLRRNDGHFAQEIKTVCIWLILDRKNPIHDKNNDADINQINTLILKNKLVNWKLQMRLWGYEPLIRINYKKRNDDEKLKLL
ncbi:hypothetical protein [uncultured Methanobrevibacter sp.]|uniref:COG1470 family protein n=1 Tax=uncultured Methanobrevibacter sp. TaxID=253161 RepID=UPI0025E7ABD9|nr:hypothetical protein [uncultured Methanobrevibacter sp.]